MFKDSTSVRNIVLAALGVLVVVTIGLVWLYMHFQYERTTTNITVSLDGVASAELLDTATDNVVQQITNGEAVTLPIGTENYIIRYTGAEGFASGQTEPIDTYSSEVTVRANYDKNRLAALYKDEIPRINQVINSYATNLSNLYDIEKGELFVRGDWYGTILRYKGEALTDRDNVVIVLNKQGEAWEVVTNPPLPSVTLRDGAEIQVPRDVREELNKKVLNYQNPAQR